VRWWESLQLKRRKEVDMASLKEVEKVADNLEQLVGELRSELTNGTDFERLTQIADEISEKADNAAQTFSTVNETLMSRIGDLTGKRSGGNRSRSSSSSQSSKSSS
jgi:septation ring formation regulator EzrA